MAYGPSTWMTRATRWGCGWRRCTCPLSCLRRWATRSSVRRRGDERAHRAGGPDRVGPTRRSGVVRRLQGLHGQGGPCRRVRRRGDPLSGVHENVGASVSERTELDLDAIVQRVNEAEDGPWFAYPDEDWGDAIWRVGTPRNHEDGEYVAEGMIRSDAEFIAHARMDVLDLITEVCQLRAIVAARPEPGENVGASVSERTELDMDTLEGSFQLYEYDAEWPANHIASDGLELIAEVRLLRATLAARDATIARLTTALAHYADEDNWSSFPEWDEVPHDWYVPDGPDRSGYEVARAALAVGEGE